MGNETCLVSLRYKVCQYRIKVINNKVTCRPRATDGNFVAGECFV